jgi:glycerol kinase
VSTRPDLVLTIDQGSHATRALLFDAHGGIRARAEVAIPTLTTGPDRIEHDPDLLADSVLEVCARVLDEAARDGAARIVAAMATQRSTIVCWDRNSGRALSPAISWQDRRNAGWLTSMNARADQVRAETGLPLSPHYGASKIRWCLDHLPAVAAGASAATLACGPLASFLVARATREGSFLADPANASRTQLWSPASGDWSAELLTMFGIRRGWLPASVPTRHDFGTLDLPGRDIPLVIVTGDQSAVPFAFGPIDPKTVYVNIGTGAFLQLACDMPAAPPLLASILFADQDRRLYAMEGTVNGAGAALRWLEEQRGIDTVSILKQLDETGLRESHPPLFRNTVSGLGSPWWRADLQPGFVGDGDDRQLVAAVLESIAFLIAENLRCMLEQRAGVQQLVATGGLARSPYLSQTLAEVCNLPVRVPGETEATARGAAALAFGIDMAAVPAGGTTWNPAGDPALAERRQRWQEMMNSTLGQ